MTAKMLLALSIVLLTAVAASAEDAAAEAEVVVDEEDGVAVLNVTNFDAFVGPKDLIMVEFYAPWCGHCQKLAPEYSKAAARLKPFGLRLAKVDASKEEALGREYMVNSYPTLVVFRNGFRVGNFDGDRSATPIFEYMMKENDPDWTPPPSQLPSLADANFTEIVSKKKLALVMFYAPWCGHCKSMEPDFEAASDELREWDIYLARVDATQEKELATRFGVQGFPTLKVLRFGRAFDYDGPRDRAGIIGHMSALTTPPSVEKTSEQGVKNELNNHYAVVVGFFKAGDKPSPLFHEYTAAANELRSKFRFVHTFDAKVAKSFDAAPESVVVLMPELFRSKYEEPRYTLTTPTAKAKEIVRFVKKNYLPLVGLRSKYNLNDYEEKPLCVVYFDVNYDDAQYTLDTQYVRDMVLDVAKDYADTKLRFAISEEEDFAEEIKSLGLDGSQNEGGRRPDVSVGCFTPSMRYAMRPEKEGEEFSAASLRRFVERLLKGEVKPYLKSEKPSADSEDVAVEVVADTYEELVHNVDKDVVMFFYAPWCSHCKEFKPKYEKMAKKLAEKRSSRLLLAKMNADANDIPLLFPPVKGYPSVFLVPARNKTNPVPLKGGDRSYKAIKEWIGEHSSLNKKGQKADEAREPFVVEPYSSEDFRKLVFAEASDSKASSGKDEL